MRSYYLFSILLLLGCGQAEVKPEAEKAPETAYQSAAFTNDKNSPQLNITLLLDLSDRIAPVKNDVNHFQRDTTLIGYFIDMFLNEIRVKGLHMAKGKFRVMFYPVPGISDIGRIVHELDIDLAAMKEPVAKKDVFRNFRQKAMRNIADLYTGAIKRNKWPGADIWGFFKKNADLAVETNPAYRNLLVIFSDGYLIEEGVKYQDKNRYSYLTSSLLDKYKLRNNPQWQQRINEFNFGLMTPPVNLSALEVLFLEMNPLPNYQHEEDVLRSVLSKWFSEMKVKRSLVNATGFPEHTMKRIQRFLSGS
jgi:hypothetical protein